MNIWKIDIYGDNTNSKAVCCTVIVRGDTEDDALQVAEKDAKLNPLHSDTLRVVSCGIATVEEAKYLPEDGENVGFIMFRSLHVPNAAG